MRYRRLGNAGIKVSELCLGTMTFGAQTDERTAGRILDMFLDLGGNFVDEANVYGSSRGASEEVVGRLIRGKRNNLVLTTKAFFAEDAALPNSGGLHRGHLIKSLNESLKRLRTDCVDVFFLHCEDMATPMEETLATLDELVEQGKVRYIGASNFSAWKIMKGLGISERNGWTRFVCIQPQYNLLVRDIEREIIPMCLSEHLGVTPWAPLAGGFLTGKYRPEKKSVGDDRLLIKPKEDTDSWERRATERNFRILDRVGQIAEARGKSCSQVALNWLCCQPVVTAPLIGARTVEQAEDNFGCIGWQLSPEELKELDDVSRIDAGYPYDFINRLARR